MKTKVYEICKKEREEMQKYLNAMI